MLVKRLKGKILQPENQVNTTHFESDSIYWSCQPLFCLLLGAFWGLPGCKVPVDKPPLFQIGHATGHLHGILTQSVDQHRALRTDTSQTLQQRTKSSKLGHLREGGGVDEGHSIKRFEDERKTK